jgi:hypothetical protein
LSGFSTPAKKDGSNDIVEVMVVYGSAKKRGAFQDLKRENTGKKY